MGIAATTEEWLKTTAAESVRQGENLRGAVRDLTLKALQGRELTVARIESVLQSVTQGINAGSESARGRTEQVFADALAGMDDALRKAAQASHIAVSRLSESGDFDRSEMKFAAQILERTAPQALVLHAPTFNTPVFLTGRRSLLGYPGWIWSRGLEAGQREADIKQIYAGGRDATSLIERYRVDYLVVGPTERAAMAINDAFLSRYPVVGQTGEYRLYKIAQP